MTDRRGPVKRGGQAFRTRRIGVPIRRFSDLYHFTLRVPYTVLLGSTFAGYVVSNMLFAMLYLIDPGGVNGARPGHFGDAFFFSVQTMSTIGFGSMAPNSWWAHLVVTVESFVGLAAVAVGTGVLFAKLSRPTARVSFADHVVLYRRNGVPSLLLRMANERSNQIVEARLHWTVLLDEETEEGEKMSRLRDLPLERDTSPLFTMSWTAIHPLDEDSPLFGLDGGPMDPRVRGFIVTFSGMDDTFKATVNARRIYTPDQIRVGQRYVDMVTRLEDGTVQIDHRKLSQTEACGAAEGADLPSWVRPEPSPGDRKELEEQVAVEADEAASDGGGEEEDG